MNSPRPLTCWKNCPEQGSIAIFAKGCPSSYPNAVKPTCIPRTCWSNCPNPQGVMGYGVCPSSFPNLIKPSCYIPQPSEEILSALNEPISAGGGGFQNDNSSNISNQIQLYNDDNVRPDNPTLPPKTCWSGCPSPLARVFLNGLCSSDFPYESKPNCGGSPNLPALPADDTKLPSDTGGYTPPSTNTDNSYSLQTDDGTTTIVIDNSAEVEALQEQLAQTQQALQDMMQAQAQGEEASQQELQALLDFIAQQQIDLANAQNNNQAQAQYDALESQIYTLQQALFTATSQPTSSDDSSTLDTLKSQLAMMQQQLALQQMSAPTPNYSEIPPTQAGLGNVPPWAWIGGVVMVGLIVFVATKK